MKKFTLFLTLAVAMANVPVAAMQTAKNAVRSVARDVVDQFTDGAFMNMDATPEVVAPQAEQQAASSKYSFAKSEDGAFRATAEDMKEFNDAITAGKQSAARKARVLKTATVAAQGAKTCGKYTAATTALVAAGAVTAAGLAYWYAPAESCAKAAEYCATSGNMVCQKAMTTCAPYLVKVNPSFWAQLVAYLKSFVA